MAAIMKRRYFLASMYVLIFVAARCTFAADDPGIYGKTDPDDYVTGRFNPAKHELFVSLSDMGIPTNRTRQTLRREAAAALKDLYAAFRKEHPGAPFWVQSSTRTFFDQKYIWDGKWNGTITVMNVQLNRAIRDPLRRALEILKFSSMPGTSRHHWGTDFDLNTLYNGYYETGEGAVLYRWLKANAARYGFCQPYTSGRSRGYSEERWHWSYMPLARSFLARWNMLYRKDPGAFSRRGLFCGSEIAGKLALEYVTAINEGCN
jgi:zinc D-Ala-D-Ala carboxypeptidase